MDYQGTIIEESLENKDILEKVKIKDNHSAQTMRGTKIVGFSCVFR